MAASCPSHAQSAHSVSEWTIHVTDRGGSATHLYSNNAGRAGSPPPRCVVLVPYPKRAAMHQHQTEHVFVYGRCEAVVQHSLCCVHERHANPSTVCSHGGNSIDFVTFETGTATARTNAVSVCPTEVESLRSSHGRATSNTCRRVLACGALLFRNFRLTRITARDIECSTGTRRLPTMNRGPNQEHVQQSQRKIFVSRCYLSGPQQSAPANSAVAGQGAVRSWNPRHGVECDAPFPRLDYRVGAVPRLCIPWMSPDYASHGRRVQRAVRADYMYHTVEAANKEGGATGVTTPAKPLPLHQQHVQQALPRFGCSCFMGSGAIGLKGPWWW